MFLRGFEGWHLVIIAGLLVVLFGARKLPDSARSIGQSLRIFKSEMKAAHDDSEPSAQTNAERSTQAVIEPGQPQMRQDGERVGAGHERL